MIRAMKIGMLVALSLAGSSMAAATSAPAATKTAAAATSSTMSPSRTSSAMTTPTANTHEKAAISQARAREIALRQVNKGTISRAVLHEEDGHLVYAFNVTRPNQTGFERVVVDANNGKLLSVTHMKA